MLEALVVLLVLAIPLASIVAFFLALGARTRLQSLEARFAALEARVGAGVVAAAHPEAVEPAPEPPSQSIDEVSEVPEPPVPPEPARPPRDAVAGPTATPTVPVPEPAGPGFEERFGTRWVVWVGGLALALGGIFLVRYSIEQGLIGPGVRLFFGGLLATALVAAGEWMRRKELVTGIAGVPSAHIPSVLTAAGTTVAYATVYVAYGLYDFIGPALAFILLGVVALATFAAALLHGPALAGLGLIGAYVAPLLVASDEPSYWALYLYLAVVSGAAFALARMRLWRWLAITAVAFGVFWIMPGLEVRSTEALSAHVFHVAIGFALTAALIVSGFLYGPSAEPSRVDGISSGALTAYLAAAALVVLASHHDGLALIAFALLAAATVAIAWRADSAAAAVPAAAVFASIVMAHWAAGPIAEHLVAPGGAAAGVAPEPAQAAVGAHLALGAAFAALFGVAGFLAQGRSERPIIPLLWAASAVFAPIAILIALYYRVAGFERSIPFAALALLLAALFAVATEVLSKRPPRPGGATAAALFAVGAVASLALALTLALERGWLTVALALMAPGIAWVARERPLPLLRWLAAGAAALVLARVAWDPRIVGGDLGAAPIFNWLLWGYGVPALAFWAAAHLLRQRADDAPARMLDSAAILFAVLTANLEIRHYIYDGDIYRADARLAELGLQVSVWLAMAIGLERLRLRTLSPVHDVAALLIASIALVAIMFGLMIGENPLLSAERIENPFFNLILLCYGLPAVLAIALALVARHTRPMAYRVAAAAAAVMLALMYLTLQVRRFYQGPLLSRTDASDAELWTYSAVWLAFGVVLLLVGILIRSQPARLASAAVILLTVLKVFLYDLAGIGGVWRALSFIGLGLVLVGIGWLYQRLLFRPAPQPAAATH